MSYKRADLVCFFSIVPLCDCSGEESFGQVGRCLNYERAIMGVVPLFHSGIVLGKKALGR